MTSTVITGISSLTTNDPAHDRGRSGILEDAWVVVDDVSGLVIDVGTGPAREADERREGQHLVRGRQVRLFDQVDDLDLVPPGQALVAERLEVGEGVEGPR